MNLAAGRPPGPVGDPAVLLSSARDHRMTGLLWSAADRSDLSLPTPVLRELAGDDLRIRRHHELLRAALREVMKNAACEAMEMLMLKGLAAQARWYSRDGERPCSDLDLAVSPRDRSRIGSFLRALDPANPLNPQIDTLIARRTIQSVDVLLPGPVELDLHLDPFKIEIPTRRLDAVWERRELVDVGISEPLATIDTSTTLIHFLVHLNKDSFARLLGFVDVARILSTELIDWQFVERFLRIQGLEVPVHGALRTVVETLDLTPPPLLQGHCWMGWRARCWDRLWPPWSRLQGEGQLREHYLRPYWLPWLARGRCGEALYWLLRRKVFLPDVYVRAFYPDQRGPYLWRLVMGRIRRFRTIGFGAAGPVTTHGLRQRQTYDEALARPTSRSEGAVTDCPEDSALPLRLRSDRVTWRRIREEIIVLEVGRSSYVGLNPTASLLWERLAEGATPAELAALLTERFAVDAEQAQNDVARFLRNLKHRDLLESVRAA